MPPIRAMFAPLLVLSLAATAGAGAQSVPGRMLSESFAHFLPVPAPGAVRGRIDRHWMSETYRRGIVAAANYARGGSVVRIWIGAGNRPDEAVQRGAAMPAPMLPPAVRRETIRGFPALVETRAMPGAPNFRYVRIALPNRIVVYLRGDLSDADHAHYLGAIDLEGLAALQPM
jgi:hypothetical protein